MEQAGPEEWVFNTYNRPTINQWIVENDLTPAHLETRNMIPMLLGLALFMAPVLALLWKHRKCRITIQTPDGEILCVINVRSGDTIHLDSLQRRLGEGVTELYSLDDSRWDFGTTVRKGMVLYLKYGME